MRRTLSVVTMAGIAILFGALSLGPWIYVNGINTGVAGPWSWLHAVPVLNSAVPTRWAMAIAPIVGIILAIGCQKAIDMVRTQPSSRGPVRVAMITAVAMALVPLTPTPLLTRPMAPTPDFVTSGAYQPYVAGGHTIVTLPLPDSGYPDPLRWSAATRQEMVIAGAYALLPNQNPLNPTDRTALFSPPWRPTSGLMASIKQGNPVPEITDTRREMTLADLRFWKAGAVIVPQGPRSVEMMTTMTNLLGYEPTWTGGVWMWDVRHLVDDPDAVLTGPEIN